MCVCVFIHTENGEGEEGNVTEKLKMHSPPPPRVGCSLMLHHAQLFSLNLPMPNSRQVSCLFVYTPEWVAGRVGFLHLRS